MARGGKRPGAGRKPGVPNKATAEIKALARKYTEKAMEELNRIALKSESDSARVAAIKELFDRGYGRPTQTLAGEDGGSALVVELVRFDGGQNA